MLEPMNVKFREHAGKSNIWKNEEEISRDLRKLDNAELHN